MATYEETVTALRTWLASLLSAQSLPAERVFWDAFGPQAQEPPGSNLSDPGSTVWARPVLSGEQPLNGASGWGWDEKQGVLVVELRCATVADEDDSGLAAMASAIADAIRFSDVDTATFGPAHVVPVRAQPHQLNVIATYQRTEFHQPGA